MKKELVGTIQELFDKQSGIIIGEDGREYYFSAIDLLEYFNIQEDIKVKFKPEQYITNKDIIYKAVLISEDEETDL